jgi:hypothetical protein
METQLWKQTWLRLTFSPRVFSSLPYNAQIWPPNASDINPSFGSSTAEEWPYCTCTQLRITLQVLVLVHTCRLAPWHENYSACDEMHLQATPAEATARPLLICKKCENAYLSWIIIKHWAVRVLRNSCLRSEDEGLEHWVLRIRSCSEPMAMRFPTSCST